MAELARGDTLVCCFTPDPQGRWRSLAPDGKVVLVDRQSSTPIQDGAPYVCTVKAPIRAKDPATRKPRADGPTTGYVVRIDHALQHAEYDSIADADLEHATLVLHLRHPTAFAHLRTRTVQAEVHEVDRPRGAPGHEVLEVQLRHGALQRTFHVARRDAVRLGIRFTRFLPNPPPPHHPLARRLLHPHPRPQAGWQPSPHDEASHLLEADASPPSIEEAGLTLEEMEILARRRLAEILIAQAYDPVSPDTRQEARLEALLVALQRHILLPLGEGRRRLHVAERCALAAHAGNLPPARLAILLSTTGHAFRLDVTTGMLQARLEALLELAPDRTEGEWNLNNLWLEQGTIRLSPRHGVRLLCDLAWKRAQRPAACSGLDLLLQRLRVHAEGLLADIELARPAPPAHGAYLLEAYPPCVRHLLRALLESVPSAVEAHAARAFLAGIGAAPARIASAIHATPAQAPPSGGSPPRLISCQQMRNLGLCAWQCGVSDPLAYYAKESLRLRRRRRGPAPENTPPSGGAG